MTDQLTEVPRKVAPPPEPPKPRRSLGGIAVVFGLIAGIALGVLGAENIRHALGMHDHSADVQQAEGGKTLWTCGMHPQVIQDKPGLCPICHMDLEPLDASKMGGAPTTGHHENLAGPPVMIDPVVIQNMGIRTAKAANGSLNRTIRAVGYLAEPDPYQQDINLRVSGWIEKLHVDVEGMAVKKGEPLFDLYSPEVQVAIEELIAARRSGEAMEGADASARRTTDVLRDSSRRKLIQWGFEESQVEAFSKLGRAPHAVTFLSPMTGHLTEKMVFNGTMVQAGMKVLRLADRSRMWLNVQAFERDLPHVTMGQKVTATVAGWPNEKIEGEVVFIHPHLDAMTRSVLVRVLLPNADYRLRQGMYATAELRVQVAENAVTIPREAILDTGVRQVAFIAGADGNFEPRTLKLGASGADGMVQVIEGISAGEEVVTSGQFLLDSESRLKEAIQKHLSAGLMKPEAGGAPVVAEKPVVKPAAGAVARKWTPQVGEVTKAYLALQRPLGERQTVETPVDPAELMATTAKLVEQAETDADRTIAKKLADTASAMKDQPLNEQRERFKAVSDAMIALIEQSPPAKQTAPKLYVMYCPMAPGKWVQDAEQLANPYYATAMKRCGEILATVDGVAP